LLAKLLVGDFDAVVVVAAGQVAVGDCDAVVVVAAGTKLLLVFYSSLPSDCWPGCCWQL
jgi:hypothetical protein